MLRGFTLRACSFGCDLIKSQSIQLLPAPSTSSNSFQRLLALSSSFQHPTLNPTHKNWLQLAVLGSCFRCAFKFPTFRKMSFTLARKEIWLDNGDLLGENWFLSSSNSGLGVSAFEFFPHEKKMTVTVLLTLLVGYVSYCN